MKQWVTPLDAEPVNERVKVHALKVYKAVKELYPRVTEVEYLPITKTLAIKVKVLNDTKLKLFNLKDTSGELHRCLSGLHTCIYRFHPELRSLIMEETE